MRNNFYALVILGLSLCIWLEQCHGFDVPQVFESNVEPYPEDKKLGPKLFTRKGKIRNAHSEREVMLMVRKGNTARYFANFTGYFVGFQFWAKKKALINLQLYKLDRYTNEANQLGYYELVAETGYFTTTKGTKTRFFDQSIALVGENVIVGVKYKDEGNAIGYRKYNDNNCKHTVLYSEDDSVGHTTSIYEQVHFDKRRCHRYSLRAIVLETDYAETGCSMHIAPSESIAFIESHTDFGSAYYPNNYYKCWIIRAESRDEEVRMESAVFDVEQGDGDSCVYDKVRIHTLKWVTDSAPKRLKTRCGTKKIHELSTNGENYMFLEFITDESYVYYGFYIGASSFQILPLDLALIIGLTVFGFLIIVAVIIVLVICYRKKHSKKKPELIVTEKEEAVVESDKEDEDDDYMINKAPVSTKLPQIFANRGRLQIGGSTRPIQPTLVKPTEANKPPPLSAQIKRPLLRPQGGEYAPIAPAAPSQPGGAFIPKQPAGAPKLAAFVTSVMKPGAVNVSGGVKPGQPQAVVTTGIASQDAALNKPMEVQVSAKGPNLAHFKSLWKKAIIPGPARYIPPAEWTRPWARPLQTTKTPMATAHDSAPSSRQPSAMKTKLPPGFVPGGKPLLPVPPPPPAPAPVGELHPEADVENASVAYPQLFTIVKTLNAANDPVKARSMWKAAAAMLPGPANYLPPSAWQRPWAMASNKNPKLKPRFSAVAPAPGPKKPGDDRPKSTDETLNNDAPKTEERARSTTPPGKKGSRVAPLMPPPVQADDKQALVQSDSPRSGSSAERSQTPPSSDDTNMNSSAEMLPKVHLKGSGSNKNQSEC